MQAVTRRSITWSLGLMLLSLGAPAAQEAPKTAAGPTPVQLTSQEDRQRMMALLNITSTPQGPPSASPDTYDESKANPYPKLPDPLLLKNGRKVTKADEWWKRRRPEIVEDFDREIYGRTPKNTPKVHWEVTSTTSGMNGDVPIITKTLVGHVDNSSYPLVTVNIQATLNTPANAAGPVPVMLQFGGFGFGAARAGGPAPAGPPALVVPNPCAPPGGARARGPVPAAGAAPGAPAIAGAPGALAAPGGPGAGRGPAGPTWQQQVLAKGWGYATVTPASIQPDCGAGLTQGIIGLVHKGQPRGLDDWGALKAWAWGASRVLDYFETDKAVNAKQVGLEGHSRYGKATVVAMAYDPRFAIAYVSSSGAGGAHISRRRFGELVDNVAGNSEYHWMAGNYLKYAGHWDDMPVDAHELVALCAPRPVFISGGKGPDMNPDGTIATKVDANGQTVAQAINDAWVDAKGMFMAAAGAGPVYTLLGKRDMGTTEFPPIETALIDGDVAFRQHSGGHTDGPNWPTFLTFADRYIKSPAQKTSTSD
jgi:hypothetical protein